MCKREGCDDNRKSPENFHLIILIKYATRGSFFAYQTFCLLTFCLQRFCLPKLVKTYGPEIPPTLLVGNHPKIGLLSRLQTRADCWLVNGTADAMIRNHEKITQPLIASSGYRYPLGMKMCKKLSYIIYIVTWQLLWNWKELEQFYL